MTKKTKIINFILSQPGQVVKRGDLVRFISSNFYGKIYNPINDRGMWCLNLQPPHYDHGCRRCGYLMHPSKVEPRFLYRIDRGIYGVKGA